MPDVLERVKRVLIGRPMSTTAMSRTLLPKRIALPIYASDALSSVAYAPDQVIVTLAIAGPAAMTQSLGVGVAVVGVMLVVVASYRQTVYAYPHGGGDYEVVSHNLGPTFGLVVASALLVDYILTVAVSISSGAHYITTAVPALAGREVVIAVTLVAVLAVLNLRGIRQAGTAFAIPTYLYMGSIGLLAVVGFAKLAAGHLGQAPTAVYDVVAQGDYASGLVGFAGAFLLMRAFSSGCAALTGVEAISNGVPSFRRPKSRNAATTLAMLGLISTAMFLSILYLARRTGVRVVDNPATQLVRAGQAAPANLRIDPVIGQLADVVFGHGSLLFLLVTFVTGLILVLAGNTAFNGFPTLASVLSRDRFLPHQLDRRGDRLTYSNGIGALATGAIVLVVVFQAQVTHLIQLYIVGVFVSFTLSQFGMIRHWTRLLRTEESARVRRRMTRSRVINAVGFLCTGTVLVIVLITKFTRGAWITLLIMATLFGLMRLIRAHYDRVRRQLRVADYGARRALPSRVRAVVLVSNFARPTMRAIASARAAAPSTLELLCVVTDEAEGRKVRAEWEESGVPLPLTLVSSPFRNIIGVILDHVRGLRRRSPREMVVVYLPQFLVSRWWERLLHNQTATRLRQALLRVPGVVITMVPWKLGEDDEVEGPQRVNDPFPVPRARAGRVGGEERRA